MSHQVYDFETAHRPQRVNYLNLWIICTCNEALPGQWFPNKNLPVMNKQFAVAALINH